MQDLTCQMASQPTPRGFAEPWPDGIDLRYPTKGAEITGLPVTVDVRESHDFDEAIAMCTGCGETVWQGTRRRTRELAQGHAEKCRALPRPATAQ